MLAQSARLEPVDFSNIGGWREDNLVEAFGAFCASARKMADHLFHTKPLGGDGETLRLLGRAALEIGKADQQQARDFFEDRFLPYRIATPQAGFLTGYFEPEVDAAKKPDATYRYPLYRRPDDLIDLRDRNRPEHMHESYRFGRQMAGGIDYFHDRASIDAGALKDRGLELAWLADRVDQFFIHVQGSARLRFYNGETMRVTYAAKSGHPYTSLGKLLCERLGATPEEMTADRLAAWMREHPEKLDGLLANNRSYIFFRESEDLPADQGPIGAAGCPLVPGRSLAVDRTLHTFGTPIWVATRNAFVGTDKPLRRLMVAHDTGSAIVGPCRGDIFIGSGMEAGSVAGKVRHEIDVITLLPKQNP